MKTLLIISITLVSLTAFGQPHKKSVVIGSKTERPNALLIINPQNSDQGVLLPQLSTGQRMAMKPSSPQENGLIVFDTSIKSYYYWTDGRWIRMNGESADGTNFHTIDPASFQALKRSGDTQQSNLVIFEADNAFVTIARASYGKAIIAPLELPHLAVLDEVTVYYMDNHYDNLKFSIQRKRLTGGSEPILSWESSGSSSSIRSQSFNQFNGLGTIDLEHYTYRILVTFDLDNSDNVDTPGEARQRLYGVKVKYQ